uniref:Integrase catalytic domain-containing protein n=1 Tax=Echeneis naucrates TaxID=173247 RepID=A0A665VK30_ECHNA
MLVPDVPTGPWQKVGTDLCHLNGKDYPVIIDYHSNFPEIAQLRNTSASGVITHMKSCFSRHGIPLVVISDNGPQYNCREFRQFSQDDGFQHITSSSLHPQGNGKAEKGVQIIKRLLKKSRDSGSDPHLALLSYRVAPLACGFSPAELLVGRKLRTTLPHIPQETDTKKLAEKQKQLKQKQKENYDKAARRLGALKEQERPQSSRILRAGLTGTGSGGERCRETADTHDVGNHTLPNNTSSTPVLRRSTRPSRLTNNLGKGM